MIRECAIEDINSINQLGVLINDNFNNVYDIQDILNKEYAYLYVFEEDNKIMGFIHVEKHFEVLEIINIVVNPDYRKKGIASKLIQHSIDTMDHERILLEVNSNNVSAINLYHKFNFKDINIRKKYYKDGDAIVMERSNI